ncbi:unnamed protein product [Closterium sp. NIES-53]
MAATPPCPARAPPCWPPPCPALPVCHPTGHRPALPCPHAALLAAAPPCQDGVSLFDLTSGTSLAPPDTANSAARSQWLTRYAAACLGVRNNLPLADRYSSPATAALDRLILPYLFPELSAFATVEDLITHLRTSDTRYRAALKAKFLDENPPPMNITLYFIVTHLPDSFRAVKDHFLELDPTDLNVNLLEKQLLAP